MTKRPRAWDWQASLLQNSTIHSYPALGFLRRFGIIIVLSSTSHIGRYVNHSSRIVQFHLHGYHLKRDFLINVLIR
jgi:hypothetical protein